MDRAPEGGDGVRAALVQLHALLAEEGAEAHVPVVGAAVANPFELSVTWNGDRTVGGGGEGGGEQQGANGNGAASWFRRGLGMLTQPRVG